MARIDFRKPGGREVVVPAGIVAAVIVVSGLHYFASTRTILLHEIFSRLYSLPIVVAAVRYGAQGGLATALLASALYLPHIVLDWHAWPVFEVRQYGEVVLFNVGPRGDGTLQPEAEERLAAVTSWMSRNRESIIGTRPGLDAWQCYAPSTRNGDTLYVHLLMRPYETFSVRGVPIKRLKSVRALSTGDELAFTTNCAILDKLAADPRGEVTIAVPASVVDEYATVLALDFDGGT